MKNLKSCKLSLALLCLLLPAMSFGQFIYIHMSPFSIFGYNSRYEVGYSYVMNTAQLSGSIPQYDLYGNYLKDTAVSKKMTSVGFGASAGTSVRLKRLGRNSALALSIHLLYNISIWGDLYQPINTDGTYVSGSSSDLNGATVQMALPVGLDYKFGTDALASRSSNIGFTLGAGLMPQYNVTILQGDESSSFASAGGANFGVNPYVKGEFSFRAYFCFKLRGIFSFGDVPLIDASKNLASSSDAPLKLTGKTNLTLTFAVLPFSYKWVKKSWYNDFESSKPYN